MISIRKLNKRFGKVKVLKDLDLEITGGGIFSIVGPNGSGKTTLIKSLLGMVIPDKGMICLNDRNISNKWEYRNDINYLAQIANFPPNLRVKELIKMIKDLRKKDTNEQKLIDLFRLDSLLNKKLGHLSGGSRQKVNIVLTFMFDSSLIILDEPTAGLDPISLIQLKKIIAEEKNKGKTILISTHIMSLVEEISDEIIFLLDGRIYFKGSLKKLKQETLENNIENAIANLLTSAND